MRTDHIDRGNVLHNNHVTLSGALDVEKPKSIIRIAKNGLVNEIFAFFSLSHAKLSDLL